MERRHADPSTLDPTTILSTLHAERASADEEARLAKEQEEDEALVSMHFAKVQAPSGEQAGVVKRVTDKPTVEALLAAKAAQAAEKPKAPVVKKRKDMAAALGIKVNKKPKV